MFQIQRGLKTMFESLTLNGASCLHCETPCNRHKRTCETIISSTFTFYILFIIFFHCHWYCYKDVFLQTGLRSAKVRFIITINQISILFLTIFFVSNHQPDKQTNYKRIIRSQRSLFIDFPIIVLILTLHHHHHHCHQHRHHPPLI